MPISGPRAIRPEELPALGRLLNATFRARCPDDMIAQFPTLFGEENLPRLVVMSQKGEIVSHAGMILRDLAFEGVALKVALVGAVATAERCRERGYATRCLNRLLALAVEEGADLAWISGDRALYSTRGAARVGRVRVFRIRAAVLPAAPADVIELGEPDLQEMAALQRREPVHFLRPREDWLFALRRHWVMNWNARFFGLRRNGRLTLWLAMNESRGNDRLPLLAEFAGERADLAAALSEAMRRMELDGAEAHLPESDAAALERLAPCDAAPTFEPTSGSFLPLCMSACFDKLRTRLAEAAGEKAARALTFSESGAGPALPEGRDDTLRIHLGEARLDVCGRAEVARLLFGSPEGVGLPAFSSAPPELAALRNAFPLPTPSYGLNFV